MLVRDVATGQILVPAFGYNKNTISEKGVHLQGRTSHPHQNYFKHLTEVE